MAHSTPPLTMSIQSCFFCNASEKDLNEKHQALYQCVICRISNCPNCSNQALIEHEKLSEKYGQLVTRPLTDSFVICENEKTDKLANTTTVLAQLTLNKIN